MTRPHKPTLTDKIAAWKSAKDIVLDELLADAGRTSRGVRIDGLQVGHADLLAHFTALISEASRTAALMAPWNAEED
jgi:hypothetical protein